ncbi:MAG: radical SAM protein [Paludibacteraceae bacterium]|nr:radical SAM protein [Paludibacteraceae bacterium]
MLKAPFIAVSRHRINLDGDGVVTLACFGSCPLRCKYCINPQCFEERDSWQTLTTEQLYTRCKPDELYFLATGGGVTFGGGEPLLRSAFISEFRRLCGPDWVLSAETSLNVKQDNVAELIPVLNHWIVDIKDTDPDIYRAYTGRDNSLVLSNLHLLADSGLTDKVTLRIPLIPDYNNEYYRQKSITLLQDLGFNHFDLFDYIIKNK